jgi:hypothetical protein
MARYPSTSIALRHLRAITVGAKSSPRWFSIHLYGLCLDEVRNEIITRPAFGQLSSETRRRYDGTVRVIPTRHIFEVGEKRSPDVGMMPIEDDGGYSADAFIKRLRKETLMSRERRRAHPLTGDKCTPEELARFYPDAADEN